MDHQDDVDKLASLIHQLWLEFGPGVAWLQRCCQQVRAIVTDMGTEFKVSRVIAPVVSTRCFPGDVVAGGRIG